MSSGGRERLRSESNFRYIRIRLGNGLHQILRDKRKRVIAIIYTVIVAMTLLIYNINRIQNPYSSSEWGDSLYFSYNNLIIVAAVFIGILMVFFFGAPLGADRLHRHLERIGLTNKAGEAPYLLNLFKDKESSCVVMEFLTYGIPISVWRDKEAEIGAVLNVVVAKIKQGKDKYRILLYVVDYEELPDVIPWHDSFTPKKDFELALGQSVLGQETINLNDIPHLLIGGSTGSGKSVLLRSLLWQCFNKGAKVYIADFKGGVDFGKVWRERTEIITSKSKLLEILEHVIDDLEFRKMKFVMEDVLNLYEYNRIHDMKLQRIIIACDEVSELFDKKGLSKEEKETLEKIEGMISTIARQGRAFGIHLLLGTQRPSADILPGQISNNIDCRICGRANGVLSKIILDDTSAADEIAKDEKGLFLDNNGTIFRGYFFGGRFDGR